MSLGELPGPAEGLSAHGGACEHPLTSQVNHWGLILHLGLQITSKEVGSPPYSEACSYSAGLRLHFLLHACQGEFHMLILMGCHEDPHISNGCEVLKSGLC